MARRLRELRSSEDLQEAPKSARNTRSQSKTLPKPTDVPERSTSFSKTRLSIRQELLEIQLGCSSIPLEPRPRPPSSHRNSEAGSKEPTPRPSRSSSKQKAEAQQPVEAGSKEPTPRPSRSSSKQKAEAQQPVDAGSKEPTPGPSRSSSKQKTEAQLPAITPRVRSSTDGEQSPAQETEANPARRSRFETWPSAEQAEEVEPLTKANSLTKETFDLLSTRSFANHLRRCNSQSQDDDPMAGTGPSILNVDTSFDSSDSESEDELDGRPLRGKARRLPSIARSSSSEDDDDEHATKEERHQKWRWRVLRRASRASASGLSPHGADALLEQLKMPLHPF